jgi:hypothetical protein
MLNYARGTGAGRDGRIDGGLDDGELLSLAASGAASVAPVAYDRRRPDAVAAVLERLKPGESAVVPLPGSPTGTGADHFVSVGILRDGRPYVYNPSPAPGDATLAVGRAGDPQPQSFVDELAKYSQRANHIAGGSVTALRVTH